MNFGWLLGGRGSAAVITLAATVLTARVLGADGFGAIVLIHTTALVVRQLCLLKTAEAVVRFGVPLRDGGRREQWTRLLAGTFKLDLLTALLAAFVAAGINLFLAPLLGLDPALQHVAWTYVLALALTGTGTARGALRVLDRFALLGALLMAGPVVRLAGVLYAGSVGAPAHWYVMIWAGALLVEHVVVLLFAWPALRSEVSSLPSYGLRQALEAEPRLGGFLKIIYWQSNLDVFPRHVVTLLVGAYFGAAGAGVFRLARDLAEVLGKPVVLLRQAIFPDLSRLWERDPRRFLHLTVRVSGAMLLIGSIFVVAALLVGDPLLVLLAGQEYRPGTPVLALLLGAATLELGGAALRPASYTLGREGAVLWIQACALVVYLPVFFALAAPWGLVAAGWAAVAMAAISLAGLTVLVRRTARTAIGPAGG